MSFPLRRLRLRRVHTSGQSGTQPGGTGSQQMTEFTEASSTANATSDQGGATNLFISGGPGGQPNQSHPGSSQNTGNQSGNDKIAGDSAKLWTNAVKRYIARLSPEDQRRVQNPDFAAPLNIQTLENITSPLRQAYEQGRVHRLLQSIKGVVNHVRSFAIVVDIAVQANPSPASLIWAALRLVLEVCSKSITLAENICGMLETIGERLALFEQWLRLFPQAKYVELSQIIEEIYYEYILFLVNGIKYFRRGGIRNLLYTTFSPSLTETFNKSNSKISKLTELLVLQVHTASYHASATRDAEMYALLKEQHVTSTNPTAISNLKFIQNSSRNDKFFKRNDILDNIHRKLDDSSGRQMSVALYGPPGVGKSQIAIEYMYRNYDKYPVIIWLDGSDHIVLETQFAQLARQIGIVPVSGNYRSEVGSWITGLNCRWLMILDNADYVDEVRAYWPAATRGSILLTSRDPRSCEEGLAQHGMQIDPFESTEGAGFVMFLLGTASSIDGATQQAALELSQAFDGLPLGLKIAVSTMSQRNYSPTQFTRDLTRSIEVVERQNVFGHRDNRTLSTLFDVVLQSLDPAALDLLDIIAFLDSKDVAIELFESSHDSSSVITNFRDAVQCLWSHSLLRFDEKKVSMIIHGYVHSFVYRRLCSSPERYGRALRKATECLDKAVPRLILTPNRNPSSWPRREKFLKHLRVLEKRAGNSMPSDCAETLIKLLTSYGYYFYETGSYQLGHEILGTTKLLIEQHQLSDPMILSQVEFAKGKLYNEHNEPWKAEPHWRDALRIINSCSQRTTESMNQMESEYLCMVYSGLGTSLTAQDRFADAEHAHRQAIANVLKLPNQTPTRLGTLYTNLGSCLLWQGRYAEAEQVLRTALLKHDRILECTLYALANVYLAQGRIAESFAMHKEVLELFSKELGHAHHCTADSCIKVGALLAHDGNEERDLDQAERFIRKGLDTYVYWGQHGQEALMRPYIARGHWKLAQVLEKIGEVHGDEVSRLKIEARAEYKIVSGKPLPAPPEAAEAALDGLLFYWSR